MKPDKNKIVFIIIIVFVVLFIGAYSIMVLGGSEEPTIENNQIPVPELEDEQKQYESKLDALNDLKEVRQTNAPSIYDERLLDSSGVYDLDLLDKEKMRIVDSIYRHGRINYSDRTYRKSNTDSVKPQVKIERNLIIEQKEKNIVAKELGLEQQLFFASTPVENKKLNPNATDEAIYVRVDGAQTVKRNYRLQMRLVKDALINNVVFPKNTAIYGFVSFKPNRAIITIENINHHPVKLTAFDLQDGSEGIYIENSFQAEARQEVVGDLVDDINITGVPQVSGIKKIFQRNNKNVKVTVHNNYKLILKVHNGQVDNRQY